MARPFPQVVKSLGGRAWRFAARVVREPYMRSQGFDVFNPFLTDYHSLTGERLRKGLAEILDPITHGRQAGVILEQGCGDGKRVTPALQHFAREVWGVDLMPARDVSNLDRYVRVDPAHKEGQLDALPDQSVDIVMIVNYVGLHPTSKFDQYVSPFNDRLAPYLLPGNYPRVLRPLGYFVICEWEARPEVRVGKRTLAEVNAQFQDLYGPADIQGFTRVSQGFCLPLYSAYIVYQKTGA